MLLGVLRDDLIESNGIECPRFGIVQRGTRKPHVGAHVWIGFGPILMMQPPEKTDLVCVRLQWLGGLAQLELAVDLFAGKPTPLVDSMLGFGQRHAICGIESTESSRGAFDNLAPHGFEDRQRQSSARKSLEHGSSIQSWGC
jgi:hypothetical protein